MATQPERFFARVRTDQAWTAILFGVLAASVGAIVAALFGWLGGAAWMGAMRQVMDQVPPDQAQLLRSFAFAASGGAALIGQDVRACHPPAARERLDELLRSQSPNHYTIRKRGQRKIIHQLPWHESGRFAGYVEISIPIPDELPHFERG